MVNSKIYKNKTIEPSGFDPEHGANNSLISVAFSELSSNFTASDPVLVVDIRTRKGTDRGEEYCAEIADAVRTILQNGFEGAQVLKILGTVGFDRHLVASYCQLQVFCHALEEITLGITSSVPGPKSAGHEIIFVAEATPVTGMEYRFLLTGPGSGSLARDMTGWISRNSFIWRTSDQDVGTSSITTQIRSAQSKGSSEKEVSTEFEITAVSSPGSGSAPTITSLTPSLASPQAALTKLDFICIPSDPDSDQIFYRFFLVGPGTASKKKLVQDWSHRNSWQWQPLTMDIGANTIEVQIRDGLHAVEGSYDATNSASFTVTAAPGGTPGTGTAPTITSLTPSLASPREEQTKLDFICIAADVDNDQIWYRFFLTGPGTASKKKLVQDWSHKNAWAWQPLTVDIGANTIEVQIRDGLHAVEGSYDANSTVSFTVTAASGAVGPGVAPTITSLTPSQASPKPNGTILSFICIASDVDLDQVLYKFCLTGPGTASKKKIVQTWGAKNFWEWNPGAEDDGANTIEVQIRDGLHAPEGSYDAVETVSYTVTAAPTGAGTLPTITSLTPSLSSPRGQGTALEFIAIVADVDNDAVLLRFYHTGPGTASKKKMVQDWSRKNSWSWTPGAADIGANTIEVQARDGNNAKEGSYDATSSASFTISANTAPTISEVYANESGDPFIDDKIRVVCDAADAEGDQIQYKFWLYRESIGSAFEALTGWQLLNWILYTVDKTDYDTFTIRAQVRDGKHAGEESFDAEHTLAVTVVRAALTSVTPSLASPKANENTIVFSALANKSSRISYRFWQKGPGTGNVWRDMTGWQNKNSWSWRTVACDIGTNYVRCEVVDNAEAWDDADVTGRRTDLTYVIS